MISLLCNTICKLALCDLQTDVSCVNDNDNECFILTYELIKLIKLIICNSMINQYSNSQGNYIMTYISLACSYRKCF